MSPCMLAVCLVAFCATMAVDGARQLKTDALKVVTLNARSLKQLPVPVFCNPTCSQVMASASSYGVLAAETVTNSGATRVKGAIGVFPGSEVTGYSSANSDGQATGGVHRSDISAQQAQEDAHTAYENLKARTKTADLSGTDLGGLTLTPGTYFFNSSAFLTGNLTLNAVANPSAMFVFQTVSTFITSVGANVFLTGGAQACNVFYQVGSSATIQTSAQIQGNLVVYTSVTLEVQAQVTGSVLALNAAVTMLDNKVTANPECGSSTPLNMPFTPSPPLAPLALEGL